MRAPACVPAATAIQQRLAFARQRECEAKALTLRAEHGKNRSGRHVQDSPLQGQLCVSQKSCQAHLQHSEMSEVSNVSGD